MWKYTGRERPPFADTTDEGQESVWDYPRPPALEHDDRLVEVRLEELEVEIASSRRTIRVLETASPPVFYIPTAGINMGLLTPARGSSLCEWKGEARYWALIEYPELGPVGWSYPKPTPEYEEIRGYLSFYPGRVECYVRGERVRPQPGGFYGGWLTDDIAGPVKGEPGTEGW